MPLHLLLHQAKLTDRDMTSNSSNIPQRGKQISEANASSSDDTADNPFSDFHATEREESVGGADASIGEAPREKDPFDDSHALTDDVEQKREK